MLSAIAARKAAKQSEPVNNASQAQKVAWTQPSTALSGLESSSEPSGSEVMTANKRKAKGQDSNGRKGHNKRLMNTHIGGTRYFEVEPSTQSPPILQEESPVTDLDSSEEENDEEGQGPPSISWTRNQEEDIGNSWTDKTHVFSPSLNSNTFRLTRDELKTMSFTAGTSCGTLILLPPGHSLTFIGTARITLLQGVVRILGTTLHTSFRSHRVFAPRSSPLVSIETLETFAVNQKTSLLHPRDPKGIILPQRVQDAIRDSDSVLFIEPLHTAVEGLGLICRSFDRIFEIDSDMGDKHAEDTIGVEGLHPLNLHSHIHPHLQPFLIPESWERAFDATVPVSLEEELTPITEISSFVALVKGPKGCGKSTFARTLLNRLITRYSHVAYLECDIGQSEFTPGGMVSLHVISKPVFGPPFTHPMLPYRAHYVGHITPRSSPSHYLSCIQSLMQTYHTDVQYAYQETLAELFPRDATSQTVDQDDDRVESFVPLVVNTQGWNKGLGGDLLRKIEEIVGATDIFDLGAQTTLPGRHVPTFSGHLHPIQPILGSSIRTHYTPADHRTLSILSYFHCFFPSRGEENVFWSTDLPLCARPPWEVNCKEAIDCIVLVGAGFEDVVPSELDAAINCGVVALVCDEDSATDMSERDPSVWPFTPGSLPPSPATSHCVGLALVRGVDSRTQTLHLLTPVSPSLFSTCRVLVKGELELPVWGMLNLRQEGTSGVTGLKWGEVPYLQMGDGEPGAIGSARKRVRRNLMRRGQM